MRTTVPSSRHLRVILLLGAVLAACERAPSPPVAPAELSSARAESTAAGTANVTAARAEAPLAEAPEPVAAPGPEPQAVDDDPPVLAALRADMPPDVSDFIRRAVICNHWAGEEPYDEDRREQIATAVQSLRCRELDGDQAELRQRFQGNEEILGRIRQSRSAPL